MPHLLSMIQAGLHHQQDLLNQACEIAFARLGKRQLLDGGVQIREDMLGLELPALDELHRLVVREVKTLYPEREISKFIMFANKNLEITIENTFHDHPGFDIGGAYYLNVDGEGGELEFRNPSMIVAPRQDLLLLFSSTYEHRVRKFTGNPRISIAFNIKFK